VDGPAARYAYRRFGKTESLPLVFCTRFRATIDHWDPALVDLLAAEREIIVFDNVGTGASTGTTPATIQGLADDGDYHEVTTRCRASGPRSPADWNEPGFPVPIAGPGEGRGRNDAVEAWPAWQALIALKHRVAR
jgi:pimeloyl-ACP methyl ester carboxylesterase